VPVCGVVDELVPELVLPGVVVVLGVPPPGALAAFGPMPAAPLVVDDDVPAELPVAPVCEELLVSADGVPDDVVPLVLVPVPVVLLLVPEVPVELPLLAASPPVVLAVDEVPVPLSEAVSLLRWQAPSAAAAASERMRLRAMEEVGVMCRSLRGWIRACCGADHVPAENPWLAPRLPIRARPVRPAWRRRRRQTSAHKAVTH
jgi:hypothetical protein